MMRWNLQPSRRLPAHRNAPVWGALLVLVLGSSAAAFELRDVQTVFLIVMENQRWTNILGNPNCPYINQTLLPQASYCAQYYSPPGLHPTLPNYLWLVSGTNFGVYDDAPPDEHLQDTTNHLAYLFDEAGISWKTYQVGLAGQSYPPTNVAYPYHFAFNPFLYFSNILTNTDYCVAHMRPYEELAGDLTNQTVSRFSIISPGLWYSMHDGGPAVGDAWLSTEVPKILASPAYQNNGALFITWDEDDFLSPQGNLGMIVLSSLAKGGGYQSTNHYTHSSTLRTMQTVFGVYPYLRDAANAADLSDLFSPTLLLPASQLTNGMFAVTAENVVSNQTYYLQANTDGSLTNWVNIATNVPATTWFMVPDPTAGSSGRRFYRLLF